MRNEVGEFCCQASPEPRLTVLAARALGRSQRALTRRAELQKRSYRSHLSKDPERWVRPGESSRLYTSVDPDRPLSFPAITRWKIWWSRRELHPGPVRLLRARLSP